MHVFINHMLQVNFLIVANYHTGRKARKGQLHNNDFSVQPTAVQVN